MKEALWEVMEMEAPLKFYVDGRDKPAFLLFPKQHWLSVEKGHCLYLNTVGLIASFSSRKKGLERLREIVENANFPITVYQVSKYGQKRGKRILFAKNMTPRINPEELSLAEGEQRVVKVFNISEWSKL